MTIIQEYGYPQPGSSATLSLDDKWQKQILYNGISRPRGNTVSYHANQKCELHHFGPHHPMKPHRLRLTNKLVMAYGMHEAMDVYKSRAATSAELKAFHRDDYIDFLQSVYPEQIHEPENERFPYNMGDDCPIFDGLFDYCSLYAGASLDGARKLNAKQSDIAINWSGGLHHAKKSEASGFCYINDIVLAILELLRHHPRVLYIDIDVHHGDGVEQAFYSTDRVMTLSFHKYDKQHFFPGTGGIEETGPTPNSNAGAHHSLNVPLMDGIDDESYTRLFKDIVGPCVDHYNPSAIVLQCGADSLGGDRLGFFNLNIRAHGDCVAFTKSFGLPLLVLGGGGYTARNVARLWAHETSVCLDQPLPAAIPADMPFISHFREPTLYPDLSIWKPNLNTKETLAAIYSSTMEQLRYFEGNPSVQMRWIPPDLGGIREDVEDELREMREEKEGRRRKRERGPGTRGELYR